MNKKIIKFIICMLIFPFILCGCSKKWEKSVQISSLKYEDDYIKGRMKNLTNNAYKATITFEVKSGSLTEKKYCYELLRPKDTVNLECLAYGMDDTYKIKIENVELDNYTIPNLSEGEIDIETLKYYFQNIYDAHNLNFISFTTDIDEMNYPYIDEIEYEKDRIIIHGTISKNNDSISYYETYNIETQELDNLYVLLYTKDDSFTSTIITKLSLM